MTNYIDLYGLGLHGLGYDVVPIPRGSKGCTVPNWQSIVADETLINAWSVSYTGLGIRGPRTVGVDIDCRNENLTQYMLDFVRDRLGYSPHRVGMPPKALLPYRCEQPFKKLKSVEFSCPEGQKHMLEVLADGQQFVATHIHPDTQSPYIWHYKDKSPVEILVVSWADLPLITENDAKAIISEFEAQCQSRGWQKKGSQRQGRTRPAVYRMPHLYTEDDVRIMLSYLDPNTGYEDWLRVGMALHHGGFPVDLWDSWSKNSPKFKPGECQKKWDSFSVGGQP